MKIKTIYTRPRIDKLLGEATDYALVSVVAGAGYGKTTAVSEYLKKAGQPYVCITLTDGDPDVLWDKLCYGLEMYDQDTANELRLMGMPVEPWPLSRVVQIAKMKCSRPLDGWT